MAQTAPGMDRRSDDRVGDDRRRGARAIERCGQLAEERERRLAHASHDSHQGPGYAAADATSCSSRTRGDLSPRKETCLSRHNRNPGRQAPDKASLAAMKEHAHRGRAGRRSDRRAASWTRQTSRRAAPRAEAFCALSSVGSRSRPSSATAEPVVWTARAVASSLDRSGKPDFMEAVARAGSDHATQGFSLVYALGRTQPAW